MNQQPVTRRKRPTVGSSLHLRPAPRTVAHSMRRKQEIDRETGEMLARLLHDLETRRSFHVAEAENLRGQINELLTNH